MASRAGIPDKITTIWFKKVRVDWERTRNFITDEVSLQPALSLLRINPADICELQTPFGGGISSGRGNPEFSDDDSDSDYDVDEESGLYIRRLQATQFARELLPQLSNLHSLRYFQSSDHGVELAEFLDLLPHLTSLRELGLAAGLPGYEVGIRNEKHFDTLISLLERNTQLRHLSVDAFMYSDDGSGNIGYCNLCLARALQVTPQLRSLHFRRTGGAVINLDLVFPEGWWQSILHLEKLNIEGEIVDPAYRFIQSLSHLSSLTSLSLSSFLSVHHIKQLHNIPSLRRLKIDISLFLDPETLAYDPEPLANAHLGDLHITKLHSLDGIGCEQMREICNITTLRKLTVGVKSQAIQRSEDTVHQLTQLSNLTYLSIALFETPNEYTETKISEPVFAALSQLRYLRIGGDSYIHRENLIAVAKHCTRLTELALDCSYFCPS